MTLKKPNMVNVLILDKNYRALLIHNIKKGSDRWEFPGGKVEKDFMCKSISRLEIAAIKEAKEELNIIIAFNQPAGQHIFGDYETQTPEGDFLCRTFFAKINYGTPEIMEKDKHDRFDYFDYNGLLMLEKQGVLVPNLRLALPELREYIR